MFSPTIHVAKPKYQQPFRKQEQTMGYFKHLSYVTAVLPVSTWNIFFQAFEVKPPGGGNTGGAQLCQATI